VRDGQVGVMTPDGIEAGIAEQPGCQRSGRALPAGELLRFDIICRIPQFRGLVADRGGGVLGFRGSWLVRAAPPFDHVERLARLSGGWRRWGRRSRLISRLLRLDVHRMVQTAAGTLIATSADGIARRAAGAAQFSVAFRAYRGSRPTSLCVDDANRIYFGEYFINRHREAVHVFMSEDDGRSWDRCYTFPAGSIRHVHALEYDTRLRMIWVLTGDYGQEAQIGLATPGFAEYRVIVQGNQQTRACSGVPTAAGLVYATDTPLEQNHVYLLDAGTGAVRRLADVQQSALFMTEACGGLWLSTIVEPSKALPTQSVHVWFSRDELCWTELYSAPRDLWSLRYFQFAAVALARGPRECPYVFLSFRGVRGLDGHCLVGTIRQPSGPNSS
jgi:hypothetical protein